MAKKTKKSKKPKNQNQSQSKEQSNPQVSTPTWQEIAEATKPLAQKAIELLDDPTKHLILPKEEVVIEKQIKIKAQPNPTHVIVTELSEPRRIQVAESLAPKKVLKAQIVAGEAKILTPEEVQRLRQGLVKADLAEGQGEGDPEQEEDDPFKPVVNLGKKVLGVFRKKKNAEDS